MKTNRRKWAVGIGVAAMIGAAFWMRALASWRPVMVAKVGFALAEIRVSPDGRWLLAEDAFGGRGAVINLQNGDFDTTSDEVRAFDKTQGAETFPRLWMKEGDMQPTFSPAPQQNVLLSGISTTSGMYYFFDGTLGFATGWSKSRREVYCAIRGVIWICDWTTGKLKKRVRYAKGIHRGGIIFSKSGVFSPDGKWLLALDEDLIGLGALRRYDVQTGKMVAVVKSASQFDSFGFSPDGRSLWFAWLGNRKIYSNFTLDVVRTSDLKPLWSTDASGAVKWLSDGRVGILQKDSFEWRDASNRLLRQLPAPSNNSSHNVEDWALSPDGDWIYTCQEDGTIQRWRAR